MNTEALIASHRLLPHPFEGHWRQTGHEDGRHREGLHLLTATEEAGWHTVDAEVTMTLEEGGPASVALSHTGVTAYGHKLLTRGDSLKIGPGVLRSLSCLGAYVLLKVRIAPDIAVGERELMPDEWFPNPEGRPKR